jgi:hypothetical protein
VAQLTIVNDGILTMHNFKIFFIMNVLIYSFFGFAKTEKCPYELGDLCAKTEYINTPTQSKSSDFKLFFYNKGSYKVPVMPTLKPHVYLWMKMKNGHEHGSDAVKIEQKKDHYLITNVWFLMKGEWELHIQLRDENGKIVHKAMRKVCIGKNC